MSEYVWGILTPFIALGGLALLIALAYLILKLALYVSSITHVRLLETIKVKKNGKDPYGQRPKRPEYYDQANKFRDALIRSPKMRLIRVLGCAVLIVRDYREVEEND